MHLCGLPEISHGLESRQGRLTHICPVALEDCQVVTGTDDSATESCLYAASQAQSNFALQYRLYRSCGTRCAKLYWGSPGF